jgi:hypothetical protein
VKRHRLYYEYPMQELIPIFSVIGIDLPDLRHDESMHCEVNGWEIDICGGIGRTRVTITAPGV